MINRRNNFINHAFLGREALALKALVSFSPATFPDNHNPQEKGYHYSPIVLKGAVRAMGHKLTAFPHKVGNVLTSFVFNLKCVFSRFLFVGKDGLKPVSVRYNNNIYCRITVVKFLISAIRLSSDWSILEAWRPFLLKGGHIE